MTEKNKEKCIRLEKNKEKCIRLEKNKEKCIRLAHLYGPGTLQYTNVKHYEGNQNSGEIWNVNQCLKRNN